MPMMHMFVAGASATGAIVGFMQGYPFPATLCFVSAIINVFVATDI